SDLAGDVDPRLDRECDAWNEQPLLAGLEVVEMRARAVQIARVDRMTRPVREILAVAARFDHVSRRVVDVGAADGRMRFCAVANEVDRRVTRVAHGFPDL